MGAQLLDRGPAKIDALGSSHQAVADAITGLMRTSNGGKSIAVLGGWGSGKSTIIELIKNALEAPNQPDGKETTVFVFDTWAHQGDHLRRAFLERVFAYLTKTLSWLDAKNAGDVNCILNRTIGRTETVKTTTRRAVSGWGAAISLQVLLLAAVVALMPKWDPSAGKEWTFTFFRFGIATVLLPILTALLAWLTQRPHWRIWKANFYTEYRDPSAQTFYQLLVRDAEEVKTSETNKNPEPTSIEFQAVFGELCQRCLTNSRRLVVVIDNLDRIDPVDALSMWSNMRVFFEFDGGERQWLDRFWLLVPMDPTALQRLWRGDGEQDLIHAFLNKTFDVVYHVPTPTLTRRKAFFLEQLKTALPTLLNEDCDLVYRLADRYRDQISSPREIKLFVNRLVTLHLQWQPQNFEISILALYILHAGFCSRATISFPTTNGSGEPEIIHRPREFDFDIPSAILDLLPDQGRENWESKLGAIHFNVKPETAGETIDGPKILRALETGDPEKVLPELQVRTWFWPVCERVVQDRANEWENGADLWASVVNTLNSLRSPSPPTSSSEVNVWSDLRAMGTRSTAWRTLTPPLLDATNVILGRSDTPCADAAELKAKLKAVATAVVPDAASEQQLKSELNGEEQKTPVALIDWVQAYLTLLDRFKGDPAFEDLCTELEPVRCAQALTILARRCAPENLSLALRRLKAVDAAATTVNLATIGYQSPVGEEYFQLLRTMRNSGLWPSVQVERNTPPWALSELDATAVSRGIRALLTLRPEALIADSFSGYLRSDLDGKIVKWIADATSPRDVAWIVLPRLALGDSAEALRSSLVSRDRLSELATEIVTALFEVSRLDVALRIVSVLKLDELGVALITSIVASGSGCELLKQREDVGLYVSAREKLDEKIRKQLTNQLTRNQVLLDAEPVQGNEPLFEDLLSIPEWPGRERWLASLLKKIRAVSPEQFLARARAGGSFMSLLVKVFAIAGTGWLPVSAIAHIISGLKPTSDAQAIGDVKLDEELVRNLEQRLELGEDSAEALLARAKGATGSAAKALYEKVIERCKSDVAMNPDQAAGHVEWGFALLGKAQLHFGKERTVSLEQSADEFRKARRIEAADEGARVGLLSALLALAQESPRSLAHELLSEALKDVRSTPLHPTLSGAALLAFARHTSDSESSDSLDQALHEFEQAVQANPANADARQGLAEALTEKAKRSPITEAEILYEKAYEQFSAIRAPSPDVLVSWARSLIAQSSGGTA